LYEKRKEPKMSVTALIETATQEFKQKLSACCEKLETERLTPELAEQVCEGLSQAISAAGVAGLRAFLEGYEEHNPTLLVKGTLFRQKQASAKTFLTPFGPMTLSRNLYQADEGGPSYVPLDASWGMEREFATPEVREAVLLACAHITPDETAFLLRKSALFHPSTTAIKHIVEKAGDFIHLHADCLDASIRAQEEPVPNTRVLAASLDGTHILLDEPGIKQGRPPERPGPQTPDESATIYKQAVVGSISFYGDKTKKDSGPPRLISRYVAHMPEAGAPTAKRRFEAELADAEAKLPLHIRKVLLLDGQRALWKYVEHNPRFDDYDKLIDFYHTSDHLSTAAELLFGKGSAKAQRWYDTYRGKLLVNDGAAKQVLRSIDYFQHHRRLSKSRRKDLKTEHTFFQRNQHRMAYAEFRRKGFPIGSGPVEAACKTLVKTRLCRSGMRWSRQGGQRILQLRTYVKSGRWDSFWKHYKQLHFANAA
jgi:hypothetical protein